MERRPHLKRACPLKDQKNCDWEQVTSWYVGGPNRTVAVPQARLTEEAELHLEAHYGLKREYYT